MKRKLLTAVIGISIIGFSSAQEPYSFKCEDYVSTDNNRAPQSAFSYDTDANTFTITASGNNNIAFQMANGTDGSYYIDNTQTWFAIVGTNISTNTSANTVWWFNGFNNGGAYNANYAISNDDGSTLLLWDIKNTDGMNSYMNYSNQFIFITANGAGIIHAIGLTAKSGNNATISNINYYAPYDIAALYPAAMSQMGYTEESLVAELISLINSLIEKNGSSKTESVKAACEKASQDIQNVGATDYAAAYAIFASLNTVCKAASSNGSYVWSRTDTGLTASNGSLYLNVQFYADDIVRILKSHNATDNKKSWTRILEAPTDLSITYDENDTYVIVQTEKVMVKIKKSNGLVQILRSSGASIISESNAGTWTPQKDGPFDSYKISTTFKLDSSEEIYGMGQIQDGQMGRRNTSFHLEQNNMFIAIPYFQSTKNYGLLWDNYSPTDFADNTTSTRFTSTGTEIDYYVIAGNNSDEVLANLRNLTGQASLAPLWNFGLYQSKERYTSADETMSVVQRYRQLKVPLDCIVQDWQYWGDNAHWNALEFLNPSFSNYQTMINTVHKLNAKIMISIWANFGPSTTPYWQLDQIGRLIPVETYPAGSGVHPYDVYSQDAQEIYWSNLYKGLISKGIDAYWMDSSEPDYVSGGPQELDYLSGFGQTWRSLRNVFVLGHSSGVYNHHREYEAAGDKYLKGKRVSILTRSGFTGQQSMGVCSWSGDVTASWDNLARQIPAALNFSACGIPYWNADIGGFFLGGYGGLGDDNWKRLYMRWTQFGTFTPMMRFHGCGCAREIYQFGRRGDKAGYFDQIEKYIKLRYRMLPYIYSTAWQVHNGKTFMQALGLAFTSDKNTYKIKDQFMFGQSFLVAPILQDNVTSRSVYLPKGTKWTNFWTGETVTGGKSVTFKGSIDQIPLYIRTGSIMPWGPDVQYSTQQQWENLEVRIYSGQDGSFTLYEDENDGYGYEEGRYTEIPFSWDEASETLTIGTRNGEFEGMLQSRTFNLVRVCPKRGLGDKHAKTFTATVTYDGNEIKVQLPFLEGDDKAEEDDDPDKPEDPNVDDPDFKSKEDITYEYIQNPSFEDNKTTLTKVAPKGWTVESNTAWWGVNNGGGGGDPESTDGKYIFGVWDGSNTLSASISQKISGLPAGKYQLTVDMHASNRDNGMRVGNQRLFANDDKAYFYEQIEDAGIGDTYPMQTLKLVFTQKTDGEDVNIGVATDGAPIETWFKIDNFRLYRPKADAINNISVEPNRSGLIYDLSGRIVNNPTKGLYISNGKKYFVK